MKDAKNEAQKEIDEYREKKEEEFKKYESEVYCSSTQPKQLANCWEQQSGNKKAEEDANKEAEKHLEDIKKAGNEKGAKVVDDLIKLVTTPHPEVPDKISKED